MNAKSKAAIPESIVQLERQFEQFRSSHAHRTRIPEALWRAAVELAQSKPYRAVPVPPPLGERTQCSPVFICQSAAYRYLSAECTQL